MCWKVHFFLTNKYVTNDNMNNRNMNKGLKYEQRLQVKITPWLNKRIKDVKKTL